MFTSFNLNFSLSTEAQTFYAVSSGDEKLLFTAISLPPMTMKKKGEKKNVYMNNTAVLLIGM